MQEQNFTPRFSVEQLTQMNAAPMPKAPENMKIDAEQWSQIARGLNVIYKQNQALSEQVTGLKAKVTELETTLDKSVDRAMKEQKKATEQEIETMMREATKQVGKTAEHACDIMEKQSGRNESLWWLRLFFMAVPTIAIIMWLAGFFISLGV